MWPPAARMGNQELRSLLVLGAIAVLRYARVAVQRAAAHGRDQVRPPCRVNIHRFSRSVKTTQIYRADAPRAAEAAASRMMAESAYKMKATPRPAPSPRTGAAAKATTNGSIAAHIAATTLRLKTPLGRQNEAAAVAKHTATAMAMVKLSDTLILPRCVLICEEMIPHFGTNREAELQGFGIRDYVSQFALTRPAWKRVDESIDFAKRLTRPWPT